MRSNKTDLILIQPKNADGMPTECRLNADGMPSFSKIKMVLLVRTLLQTFISKGVITCLKVS